MEVGNINTILEQVSKEKNLDKQILIDAMKEAMISAARKILGLQAELEAEFFEEDGEIAVYEFKTIAREVTNPSIEISYEDAKAQAEIEGHELSEEDIGEEFGLRIRSKEFGRIAAQTAKQVIIQKIREAERSTVFDEYKDRKDELVTGIVRRFERGNVIVDLGRAEAVMPYRQQVPRENVRAGDRVVAYVLDVLEAARGSQIILSRTSEQLAVKLFEQEVPEIKDGVIAITAAAREPGVRTKIAVVSRDPDVDAEGACIGLKGARVQAVVQELRGEKVDIVRHDEDDARFVCNALSPAQVTRVLVDEENHGMQIVVPDDQLSLAIGRRGQNVRLAAQLTGWKLDITSETKVAEEREVAWESLARIEGLNDILVQTLYNHGFRSAQDIVEAESEFILSIPGFDSVEPDDLKARASAVVEIEIEERKAMSVEARKHADVLLKATRQDDVGGASVERLNAYQSYLEEGLSFLDMKTVSDLYFDHWEERLEESVGLSESKAKVLRYEAGQWIAQHDNGFENQIDVPTDAEVKEAENFDASQAGPAEQDPLVEDGTDVAEEAAAPA